MNAQSRPLPKISRVTRSSISNACVQKESPDATGNVPPLYCWRGAPDDGRSVEAAPPDAVAEAGVSARHAARGSAAEAGYLPVEPVAVAQVSASEPDVAPFPGPERCVPAEPVAARDCFVPYWSAQAEPGSRAEACSAGVRHYSQTADEAARSHEVVRGGCSPAEAPAWCSRVDAARACLRLRSHSEPAPRVLPAEWPALPHERSKLPAEVWRQLPDVRSLPKPIVLGRCAQLVRAAAAPR